MLGGSRGVGGGRVGSAGVGGDLVQPDGLAGRKPADEGHRRAFRPDAGSSLVQAKVPARMGQRARRPDARPLRALHDEGVRAGLFERQGLQACADAGAHTGIVPLRGGGAPRAEPGGEREGTLEALGRERQPDREYAAGHRATRLEREAASRQVPYGAPDEFARPEVQPAGEAYGRRGAQRCFARDDVDAHGVRDGNARVRTPGEALEPFVVGDGRDVEHRVEEGVPLAVAAALAGCSAGDPQGRFDGGVRGPVAARLGAKYRPVWRRGGPEEAQADAAVADLLRRPLTRAGGGAGGAAQQPVRSRRSSRRSASPTASTSAPDGSRIPPSPPAGGCRTGPRTSQDWEAAVSQDFLDALLLPLRRRLAAEQLRQVENRVADETLRLAAEVQRAFYTYQARRQLIGRLELIADTDAAAADFTRSLHDAGNVNDLDLASQQATSSQSRIDVTQVRAQTLGDREAVNRLLGLGRRRRPARGRRRRPCRPSRGGEPDTAALEEPRPPATARPPGPPARSSRPPSRRWPCAPGRGGSRRAWCSASTASANPRASTSRGRRWTSNCRSSTRARARSPR